MTLGEKLQQLRLKKGLSQEQLAEALDVSRQSVSKWESGQSRPDMDKLVTLAALFEVSTDYLLGGDSQPAPPSRRRNRTAVLLGTCLALALAAALGLGWAYAGARSAAAETETENQSLQEESSWLRQDLQAAQAALDQEQSGQPRTFEELEAYFYQFGQAYRLDYIPTFTQGNAPTESAEYLLFAYVINKDNWGDQNTMSRDYVNEVVSTYFGVGGLAHTSLPKCWIFDGKDTYTPVPSGLNPVPVYFLQSYRTYRDENGQVCHEVILDKCSHKEGEIDPATMGQDTLEKLLDDYDRADFIPIMREKFVYVARTRSWDQRPLFLSHEILERYR